MQIEIGKEGVVVTESSRRIQNRQRILENLYVYGPVSRVDIAKQTGITPATVSTMTAQMIDAGEVEEVGEETGTQGRPRILLQLTGGNVCYVGCELRAEAFTFVLIDAAGQILDKCATRFKQRFDAKEINIPALIKALKDFLAAHSEQNIVAIGMGIPGHYVTSTHHTASDHPLWSTFDFTAVNDAFDLPIYYENNVHSMAMTERLFNSHRNDETFIFFHVALGVVCSTVYHGRVYGRANPLVGEVAHMVVNTEGELCTCGRHGCLQTYCSENWIMRKARLLYKQADSTYLRQLAKDPETLTFEDVLQAYDLGDIGVMSILSTAIKYLAVAVTNFPLLIDAQRIILHGRIFERPALFTQLQQYLRTNQVMFATVTQKRLVVKPVSLFDGAVGAAGMAICRDRLGFK